MDKGKLPALRKRGREMNRFKCPACGGNQYTACDIAEGCIYCGHRELVKMDKLEPEESEGVEMMPIIFSTPMIQAILDGKKTQTRRIVRPQPPPQFVDYFEKRGDGFKAYMVPGEPCDYPLIKPKYQPGDILWVRETWRVGAWNENTGCIAVDYKADGFARREWIEIKDPKLFEQYWIQSTDDAVKAGLETDSDGQYHWEPGKGPTRWRPSIFMPREAARIFLKVTNVRVERLQDITQEEARAEGCSTKILNDGWKNISTLTARDEFITLWEHLNAKRGYGWDTNPWVWVIEFERINKER